MSETECQIQDYSDLPIGNDGRRVITEPGIYRGVPSDAYHAADITPTPALSSSMARKLVDECPAYLWHNSSLNPDRVEEQTDAFELGQAMHALYLEPSAFAERVVSVDADSWRTKAAQEQRTAIRAERRIPLLQAQFEAMRQMAAAPFEHPHAAKAFRGGEAELSAFWRDAETGVWLKARPDYTGPSWAWLVDYKTSTTANPKAFERKAWDLGYHQQASWYLDGVELMTGVRPAAMWFIVQDKSPPHLVSVTRYRPEALDVARVENRKAIRLFARCLEHNDWPGYRHPETPDVDTAFELHIPRWAVGQALDALSG